MKTWFTADTHFTHEGIARYYPNRPGGGDPYAMDDAIILAWNATVGKDDLVYHLGDVMGPRTDRTSLVLNQLNGHIILIAGNHDAPLQKPVNHRRFVSIAPHLETVIEGHRVALSHYPHTSFSNPDAKRIRLYGHSHGKPRQDAPPNSLDVGIDHVGLAPISIQRAIELIQG